MPDAIKTAIVLAAGFGKRMRPITDTIPKPLIKAGNITLLDRILDKLSSQHVDTIIINSHYKADILKAHTHKRLETLSGTASITLSHEETILETGGGIMQALPLLGDAPFFVINGDVLWLDEGQPALERLNQGWDNETMDSLMLLHPTQKAIGYEGEGDFNLAQNGAIIRPDVIASLPYVFTGISVVHPRLFHHAPPIPFSLNALYWRNREPNGTLKRIFGIAHQGTWLHIGTPQGLEEAESFLKLKA